MDCTNSNTLITLQISSSSVALFLSYGHELKQARALPQNIGFLFLFLQACRTRFQKIKQTFNDDLFPLEWFITPPN